MTNEIMKREKTNVPAQQELEQNFVSALQVVDDIVLKNYVSKLQNLEIVPLSDDAIQNNLVDNVRIFKITEMVYEKDEYSTYKFASVFNALSTANCSVFVVIDSNGEKTDFYMGVRSLNSDRTTASLGATLKNAMIGQFPGIKTAEYTCDEKDTHNMQDLVKKIKTNSVSVVSCVANHKDEKTLDNKSFLQGLEKLSLSMQGEKYTAIILANGTTQEQLGAIRRGYENIYSQLSPFATTQVSYANNESSSLSQGYTKGTSKSLTMSTNFTATSGNTTSKSSSDSYSESKEGTASKVIKGVSSAASILGAALAPVTGGASLVVGGVVSGGLGLLGSAVQKTETKGTTVSISDSESYSEAKSEGKSEQSGTNESKTDTVSLQIGKTENIMMTMQNKTVIDMLERVDMQLKRLQEFESLGMWECAAYFMSENPYSAEIAASTYKALMRGENSGVEVSAINSWGKGDESKTAELSKYIKNFIHPVFSYQNDVSQIEVTPCTLVSGNELALHMGLPRKSVCGFPVIEHADFGKEIVSYNGFKTTKTLNLGKVFNMGSECNNKVELDRQSLTMHTFVTGSTGSGKSNTVYEMLRQLKTLGIGFMVIEPAKGEYKNVFGKYQDVVVLGTNPEYSRLLQINPFKFPPKTHILEHIDRLIEIFNVCWPMYAAMPAVLKDAVLQAYEVCGWDLVKSVNRYSNDLFPTFIDLQNELVNVIENSAYSQEVKSNYMGSLLTRVKSLTNGLNGQIFSSKEIDNSILFDDNVIVDLSRVGSLETKSLIMGILVMRLSEHRAAYSNGMNLPLKHITVLEEAHNILKRTSTEQNPESSNVAGKSVEMISNAIAEMRTYGEGFIIADQSPNAVDISAIRNTNTKIIMRLPDESDRKLAGKSAALNDEQIDEIAKLPRGVAVVYQNDWIEPVLCKIRKYDGTEELYNYHREEEVSVDERIYKTELFKLLLKGRTSEELEPDIDLIKEHLSNASLSTKNKIGILHFIDEYVHTDKLEIWKDEKFDCLSKIVFEFINDNGSVENLILTSRTFDDITSALSKEVQKHTENLSGELLLSVCQCLMKEFSKGNDEKLTIYAAWRKEIVDKEVF